MNSDRLLPLNELRKFSNRQKELAQLELTISNYAFEADVLWCRFARNERWNVAIHNHSFYELHFCLSGFAKFCNNKNEVLSLQPGSFVIFQAGQEHRLSFSSENFEKLVFAFHLTLKPSEDLPFFESAYNNISFNVFEASDKMIRYTQKLCEESNSDSPAYKLSVTNLLSELILEIARIITPQHHSRKILYKNKDNRLDTLVLFIRDNLSHHLTSEDFAAESNMSIKQLNRLMEATYHMSVSDFFRKERIEKAKQLLIDTTYTIAQIAQEVGFSDEFSFSKTFKRMTGVPPGFFRTSFLSGSDSLDDNTIT